MAVKKSDLYSSLWASCDELRGGMDASQYKDYVLFMLFIKYVSDKYANSDDLEPPITIPKGASFNDMIALKGCLCPLEKSLCVLIRGVTLVGVGQGRCCPSLCSRFWLEPRR
jgi:hypothetical protein